VELRPPTEWERAIEGVVRPVRYRGRIVGHERRYDVAALVRMLGRCAMLPEMENRGDKFLLPMMPNFCQLSGRRFPGWTPSLGRQRLRAARLQAAEELGIGPLRSIQAA
jgi:hypothetical protein